MKIVPSAFMFFSGEYGEFGERPENIGLERNLRIGEHWGIWGIA